jgi:hypothetical protein
VHKHSPRRIAGDCLTTMVVGGILGAMSIGIILHGFAATLNAAGDAFRAAFGA